MYFLFLIVEFTISKEKSSKSSSKDEGWTYHTHRSTRSCNEILLILAIMNFLVVLYRQMKKLQDFNALEWYHSF